MLALKNAAISKLINKTMDLILGERMNFKSFDTIINSNKSVLHPIQFLNSIKLSGAP